MDKLKIYKKVIKTYGKQHQILLAVEELAELQKELLKNFNRNATNISAIIDEIADVHIMLEQLEIIYKIDGSECNAAIVKKLKRLKTLVYGIESTQLNENDLFNRILANTENERIDNSMTLGA